MRKPSSRFDSSALRRKRNDVVLVLNVWILIHRVNVRIANGVVEEEED